MCSIIVVHRVSGMGSYEHNKWTYLINILQVLVKFGTSVVQGAHRAVELEGTGT